jgi:hypothetical protein
LTLSAAVAAAAANERIIKSNYGFHERMPKAHYGTNNAEQVFGLYIILLLLLSLLFYSNLIMFLFQLIEHRFEFSPITSADASSAAAADAAAERYNISFRPNRLQLFNYLLSLSRSLAPLHARFTRQIFSLIAIDRLYVFLFSHLTRKSCCVCWGMAMSE